MQVRLEHMLARLRVLQGAATAAPPARLAPRLFLSGAVEAASHHLLRHLGITHILNATEVRALMTPRDLGILLQFVSHNGTGGCQPRPAAPPGHPAHLNAMKQCKFSMPQR